MFAPRMHKGTLTLSHQDFRYFVDPVLRPWGIGKKPVRRIVLDVGHGGQDDGAKGTKLLEKNINLMLARRVKSMLEQYRYEVLLTRKDDSFPSLDARTKMAKAKGADLFISIHNNSATVKTVNGIETFLVTPQYGASIHKNDVEKTKVAGNANDAYNGPSCLQHSPPAHQLHQSQRPWREVPALQSPTGCPLPRRPARNRLPE